MLMATEIHRPALTPGHFRILAVDDEPAVLKVLKRVLAGQPFDLVTASSGDEGIALLNEFSQEGTLPAVVISDYKMPGMNGVKFLAEVKDRWPTTQRILLTAVADQYVLEDAINRSEIYKFVQKPWDRHELVATLRSACTQYDLVRENRRLMVEMEKKTVELQVLNSSLEELVAARTNQLLQAKRAWEATFDVIQDPVILITDTFAVTRANKQVADNMGSAVGKLPGSKCYRVLAGANEPCRGCPIAAVRHTGAAASSKIMLSRRDVIYAVSAYPLSTGDSGSLGHEARFVCVYRDITGEERMQRKLLQSEKMNALGVLSGAVAHEINNPLGGILAFTQIMMREVSPEDENHLFLCQIEESAQRCQKTVRNLLDFARFSPREERQNTTLGTVVSKAVELVGHRLALNSIKVVNDVLDDADRASVIVNSNQVQMVFVNLLHNASDAMEQGGTITIRFAADKSVSPAVVVTQVTDQGGGINEFDLPKIFDPFFTTKEEGKGTGLGLALAYQVVRENLGTIDVESTVGKGTSFTLTFPIASSDAPT
jgi:two-component system NtrC family sensor kinase